ncbi:uncharacterized protein [Macrobrachium rosenbergii]|uniref:uncharacterized protein isoform X2 n=1 Tax=Macrobrachium rosenbergii TaxID=79674 RepID=UPI0034D53820
MELPSKMRKHPEEEAVALNTGEQRPHHSVDANSGCRRNGNPPRFYEWEHFLQIWRLSQWPSVSSVEEARVGISDMTVGPGGRFPIRKRFPHGRRIGSFKVSGNKKRKLAIKDQTCDNTVLGKGDKKEEILENILVCEKSETKDGGWKSNEMNENCKENSKSYERMGRATYQNVEKTQEPSEYQDFLEDQGYLDDLSVEKRSPDEQGTGDGLKYDKKDNTRYESFPNGEGSGENWNPEIYQEQEGNAEFIENDGVLENQDYVEEEVENVWYPGCHEVGAVNMETTPINYYPEADDGYEDDEEYVYGAEYYCADYNDDTENYGETQDCCGTEYCDGTEYEESNNYEEGSESRQNIEIKDNVAEYRKTADCTEDAEHSGIKDYGENAEYEET